MKFLSLLIGRFLCFVSVLCAGLPVLRIGKVAEGFERPTHITSARDGSNRLFVSEQAGRIRILRRGKILARAFLDIRDQVVCCGERGLLSVAFPPDYATKQYFYAAYINLQGTEVISRFHTDRENPDLARPDTETPILVVEQASAFHKGGQLAFSPASGYLYVGLGDGEAGGDPLQNAQNPDRLLGKILRLDVESGVAPYRVPPDNPFVGRDGYRPEIWALGLRNPWRFSFDRATGDLYIGDVGQDGFEEINFEPAASPGGQNYGWNITEGPYCFNDEACSGEGLTLPIMAYAHQPGYCAVTAGFVYRGQRFPSASGLYLFGDFCSGGVFGALYDGSQWQLSELLMTDMNMSTFGEDEAGEIHVAFYAEGEIYRITFD